MSDRHGDAGKSNHYKSQSRPPEATARQNGADRQFRNATSGVLDLQPRISDIRKPMLAIPLEAAAQETANRRGRLGWQGLPVKFRLKRYRQVVRQRFAAEQIAP